MATLKSGSEKSKIQKILLFLSFLRIGASSDQEVGKKKVPTPSCQKKFRWFSPPLPFQKSSATIIIKKKSPPYHFSIWPTKNFSMHTNATIQCEKFIEGSLLSKKTRNTKNTLSVACLKNVSNEELLLLPLSDFWDVRNTKWMSNVFGTFGQQNSSRMERLFGKSKFDWSIPGIVPSP